MAFPRFNVDFEDVDVDDIDLEDVSEQIRIYAHGVINDLIDSTDGKVTVEGHGHYSDDNYACNDCRRASMDGKR